MPGFPEVPHARNFGNENLPGAGNPDPIWWSYVSLAVRTLIQIGMSAILARVLSPADYGMAAMLGTLLALLTMASEMGLNWVTIQRAGLTTNEVDTLFWFNMLFGILAGLCCFAAAPLLANFYGAPDLVWGARAASLLFPFSAFAVQPLALMRRSIRLKSVFLVEAGAVFAGGCVGIALALEWRNYQALIVQGVVTQAIRSALALWISGYRPARPRKLRAGFAHLGDGAWMQAFQVFTQVFRNFDNVLIGAHSGARELGFYTRAYYLTTVPSQLTVGTLNESAIPALSRAWNSKGDFEGIYRRYLKAASAVSFPLAVIMACCAPELIYFQYGPKWSGVDRLLAIMSLTTAVQPLYNSSYWLLIAAGQFRLMAAIGALNCGVLLLAFWLGVQAGAVGVAEAYGSVMVVLTITTLACAHRSVRLSLSRTLTTLKWPVVMSVLLTGALLGVRAFAGRLKLLPGPTLALLSGATGLILTAWVLVPITRRMMTQGKILREITPHDAVSEIRRFLRDEQYIH